nr:hypothetical protein [Tanacetum cinerariifolium]
GVTYDEEREMEPRPEQNRETTPPLRMRSPRVRSTPRKKREWPSSTILFDLRIRRPSAFD